MSIPLIKRGHLYVLEHCRVYVEGDGIEYTSAQEEGPRSYNIPVRNTSFLLLGPGSSITNEAVQRFRQEGVCFGFCGSGGTPLMSAEAPGHVMETPDLIMPADEHRDSKFLQAWITFWPDPNKRLTAARLLMLERIAQINRCWESPSMPSPRPVVPDRDIRKIEKSIERAQTIEQLLVYEGELTKTLYREAASIAGFHDFKRLPQSRTGDNDPNTLLDDGHYLAYGLASVVLWTLGIPSGLPVMHGKTRRGGLVFDIADVIKDAMVLPIAFSMARQVANGPSETVDFRSRCLTVFDDLNAIDVMFSAVQSVIDECAG